MTAPALRPLSLGEVLDVGFGLYRMRFPALLVIAVACRLLPILIGVYLDAGELTPLNFGLRLGASLLALVFSAVAVAASTFVVSEAYLGREISAGAALSGALTFTWRLVGISLLTSLVVGLGLLLFIVPGLILLTGFLLSPVAAVLEGRRALAAMRRSWELTVGHKSKVFFVLLVSFLLLMLPLLAVGALGGLFGMGEGGASDLAVLVLPLVIQVFVYPFVYVVQTVLYYDLRVRGEGFDLDLLAATLPAR